MCFALSSGAAPLEELLGLRRLARGRLGLVPVVEDRSLGATREDRLGDPVDPNARAPAAAALVARDRFERVDLVGAHPLAEAEEDHPRRAVAHFPLRRRPSRRLRFWMSSVEPTLMTKSSQGYSNHVSSCEYGGAH